MPRRAQQRGFMGSRLARARMRAFLASVSLAALSAAPAGAQDPTAAMEEIVIRGINLSRQIAVENKRNADAILDSVSADDLGRLPDKNSAEALSRLPGVNITIDQGEGRYVSIRGASPALNSVTINGLAVGSVEENSRRVPLDILGGELLGGIEVVKAVTPDMEANAIGGYINVKTQSPHDSEQSYFGLRHASAATSSAACIPGRPTQPSAASSAATRRWACFSGRATATATSGPRVYTSTTGATCRGLRVARRKATSSTSMTSTAGA
jgi:TonB-dependent receptor